VAEPSTSPVSRSTLDQLQLHIGDRLQLELLTDSTRSHYYTLLVGYVPGHSVLLRTPVVQNLPIPVREGEPVLVRSFTGRHASTFETTVLKVSRTPFPYLHLAYPQSVQQTQVRGAVRVRANLVGTAFNAERGDNELPVPINIADLSVSGALLEAGSLLGNAGGKIELAFRFLVQPNNYEVRLTTGAEVQSVRMARQKHGSDEVFVHGVRFIGLHTTESLLLQSFIQHVLLSDHSQVV
jgi:c-di-GMP-binding flagellar brake protein YcgR